MMSPAAAMPPTFEPCVNAVWMLLRSAVVNAAVAALWPPICRVMRSDLVNALTSGLRLAAAWGVSMFVIGVDMGIDLTASLTAVFAASPMWVGNGILYVG